MPHGSAAASASCQLAAGSATAYLAKERHRRASGTIRRDSATSGHIELDPGTQLPTNFVPSIYTFHLWNKVAGHMAQEDELPGPTDDSRDAGCIAQKKGPTQAMTLRGHALYPNSNALGKWVASNLVQYPNRDVLVAFPRFPRSALSLRGSADLRFIQCTIHWLRTGA